MVIEKLTGDLGDRKKWRQYKARVKALPPNYRTAAEAVERYLMRFGTGGGGLAIFDDLVDLFEQSAATRTPIRDIVGDDPVEFIELFVRNYPKGQWILREQERLTRAIDRAADMEIEPT
jgi:DNA-binding ferritin-like protein (Dps family)